jgi:hypothetical protein
MNKHTTHSFLRTRGTHTRTRCPIGAYSHSQIDKNKRDKQLPLLFGLEVASSSYGKEIACFLTGKASTDKIKVEKFHERMAKDHVLSLPSMSHHPRPEVRRNKLTKYLC